MASTAEQLLARAGYGSNIITPDYIKDIAGQLATYVDQGGLTFDDAFVELRTQLEGRRAGTGGYTNTTGGTSSGGKTEPIPDLIRVLTPLFGVEGAKNFILSDPEGAAQLASKLLAGTFGSASGSGGTGRTVFPWEQQGAELDNQLKQLQLDAARNPGSRFTNVNGYMVDSLTGNLVDPTDLGVSRFNADTSRQLANFQTGPQFEENKRQFDVTEGRNALAQQSTSRLQAAQTEATLGNLGLDRSRFITEVLRNPADGLARIYSQRGGTSPLQQISMADILNSFNNQTASIRDATNANLARLGGAQVGFPAVKPPVAPAATPSAYPDYNSTNPDEPGGAYNPANTDTPYDGWYDPGAEQQQLMTQDVNPGGSYGIQEALELLQADANAGRLARGGYTNKSRFIVGDQRSGVPTGHEELVVNPTNAPIAVVPNKMLPKVSRFTGPRYDEGTGSYGPKRVLEAKPTGGFMNSLREVLGDVGDSINDAAGEARSRFESDFAADPTQFAMGPGSAVGSVDDVAKMFKKMSASERVAYGLSKGVDESRFDPSDLLKAKLEDAQSRYEKLAKGNTALNYKKIKETRAEIDTLRGELQKTRDTVGPEAKRQQLMQSYSDSFEEMKKFRTMADDYVERETGGQYKSADELLERWDSLNLKEAAGPEFEALRKLVNSNPVYGYTLSAKRNSEVAGSLVGLSGKATEGIDEIAPGKSTKDSLDEVLGTSRFADGTLFGGAYDLGYGGTTNQQQLIDMSRQAAGPGGNSVLSGQMPDRFRIPGLPTPTYRQFNSLSGAERDALRPRLAAEFNSSLEDLMFDIQQRYGTNQSRMARFRG